MSSSYQQRNLGTEDYQANAKERDAARKSYIKDFTGVANSQIKGMTAAAKLQKYVDDAELSDFKETQKALREFTQKVGVPIVKMKWQEEINQGTEEYVTRDIDRTQRWNKKRAEIEELAAKSEGNYQELWQKAKTQLLEEDRNRLLNMSHFEQMGWARARVNEKIKTFRLDRDSYLATSDEILYTDEGIEFKAKEYKEVPGGYEIASASFMNQWYGENARGGGFTKNFSQTKILPAVLEEENAAKSEYYKNLRTEKNEDRIDGNNQALFNAFEDGEDDVDSITRALNTSHIALPSLHNSNNARGGGYVNWRGNVTNQIKALATSQPYYRPEQLKAALKKWKVPGKNGQTLYQAYPDEFSDKIIDGYFDAAARTQGSAALSAQENKKNIFQQDMADLKQKLVDERGMPGDDVMKEFSKTAAYLNMTGNEIAIMRGDLLQKNRTEQEQMLYLESQLDPAGQMSQVQLDSIKGVSTQVKQEFAKRDRVVVDSPFLEGEDNFTAWFAGKKTLNNTIESKAKYHGLQSGTKFKLDAQSQIALRKLEKEGIQLGVEGLNVKGLVQGAKERWEQRNELRKESPGIAPYSKAQAIKDQASDIAEAFKRLQDRPEFSNHPLYVGTGQGFKNINLAQETTEYKLNQRNRDTIITLQEVVAREGSEGIQLLPVSIIGEKDWLIDSSTKKMPGTVFQLMAGADNTSGLDAWDYYNIFAEKAGKKDLIRTKPPEVELLKEQISYKYIMSMYRDPGSTVCVDQCLNSGGIVTSRRLQNTIQSSNLMASPTFFGTGQFRSVGLSRKELAAIRERDAIYNSLGTKK